MTWQVRLTEEFDGWNTRAYVWRELDGERHLWTPGPSGGMMRVLTAADETVVIEPSMILPPGVGQAMLDAFSRHYHGAEDTRSLRKDYDAERARVDKLIDLATRPPIILPGVQP